MAYEKFVRVMLEKASKKDVAEPYISTNIEKEKIQSVLSSIQKGKNPRQMVVKEE